MLATFRAREVAFLSTASTERKPRMLARVPSSSATPCTSRYSSYWMRSMRYARTVWGDEPLASRCSLKRTSSRERGLGGSASSADASVGVFTGTVPEGTPARGECNKPVAREVEGCRRRRSCALDDHGDDRGGG